MTTTEFDCRHCIAFPRHPCETREEAQSCANFIQPPSSDISQEAAEAMLDTLIMLTDCNLSAPARAAVDAAIAKARV